MSLIHYEYPRQRITVIHDGSSRSLEGSALTTEVVLRENAVNNAALLANDEIGETFLNKCEINDFLQIEFMYEDAPSAAWKQKFGGWIKGLRPEFTERGELLRLDALGLGIALNRMRVAQQYGSQSKNPSLNTIKEILTDASYGIIPKYVEKVLASALSSGYSVNTSKVADLTSDFKYLYFPFKPALKSLQDMIDLITAANVPSAGAHFTVIPDGQTPYLCLATVGAHENPPADIWPTWFNQDQERSTIEVTKDMVTSHFHKLSQEGNYIVLAGSFQRPANGDIWTENNANEWDVEGNAVVENEDSIYKIGSYSIRGRIANAWDLGGIYYPGATNLNFDITKIGTEKTIPRVGFYIQRNAEVDIDAIGASAVLLKIGTGAVGNADCFYQYLKNEIAIADKMYHLSFPIGPYHDMEESSEWEWYVNGSPDWHDIDYIDWYFGSKGAGDARLYIDGLYLAGIVIRGAYDSTKIGSQKCKMMFLKDDVPKDDSLIAADDSGMMAQFCKAELYRAITQPIQGRIKVPLLVDVWPGQLSHIHASRKVTGFHIDKNMRLSETTLHYGLDGAFSFLSLTDDVLNSRPIPPLTAYNALWKAVSPNFQDRQISSLQTTQVDIEQAVLAKDYPS